MRFSFFVIAVTLAAPLLGACDSSSNNADAALIVVDGAPKNACLAYGQGYVCQTGTVCTAGFVNKEDLDCAATGNICCGPIGDGGATDASDDVNVFVDAAVFETGPGDGGAVDAGHDAGTDSGHDATVDATAQDAGSHDAGDASSHDASDAASHDASDGGAGDGHAVVPDGSSDAKTG